MTVLLNKPNILLRILDLNLKLISPVADNPITVEIRKANSVIFHTGLFWVKAWLEAENILKLE